MELKVEEISLKHNIQSFKCSNQSLNTYLQSNAYYENIMKFANTKIVTIGEDVVAYFTIEFKSIEIVEDALTESYPSIHLKCLAVDEKYMNTGIGTTLLEHITVESEEISKFIGCRCLLIHALIEKATWYQDRGFQYLDEDQNKDIYDTTVPMFIDFRDSDLIIDYFEEV